LPELTRDPAAVARFRDEARAAARLEHPALPSVYDTVSAAGTEAIVMEMVEGETLRDHLDARGPLPPTATAALARCLAAGLDAAHDAGIDLRDIDPSDVVLSPDYRVRLGHQAMTHALYPTEPYLAEPDPQQRDDPESNDRAREDVAALATIVHECITGRPPRLRGSRPGKGGTRPDGVPKAQRLRSRVPRAAAEVLRAGLSPGSQRVHPSGTTEATTPTATDFADAFCRALAVEVGDQIVIDLRVDAGPGSVGPLSRSSAGPSSEPHTRSGRPPGRQPSTRQKWFALAAVSAAVLVTGSIVFAGSTDTSDPDQTTLEADFSPAGPTSVIPQLGTDSPSGATSPPGIVRDNAAPAADKPTPSAIRSFDPPPGDGAEHPELTGAVLDGNPTTAWTTETYTTRSFGGLKTGVGLVVELSEPHVLDELVVHSPIDDWAAQIHLTTGDATDPAAWGDPIDGRSGLNGSATFDLRRVRATAVLVWITDLGPTGRFEITELEIT
jgi:serine/threonine-protein kinase